MVTRLLCAVLGGHAWSLPRAVNGRLRLVCQYGCGAMSQGIETRGQELAKRPINLLSYRADRSVWSERKERVA